MHLKEHVCLVMQGCPNLYKAQGNQRPTLRMDHGLTGIHHSNGSARQRVLLL